MKEISNQKSFFLLSSIILLGFFLYFPSIYFDLLINFDDDLLISNNTQVQHFNFSSIHQIFNEAVFGLYHPITTLSWAIENYFWGNNTKIYHLNNIILHLVNTMLVYSFVKNLIKSKHVALFSSLLFIIHPMHVENIAWLSSRKDLVYTFFFILGLIQYLKFKENHKKHQLLFTYLWFILSLFSKPNAITFPLILLLIDFFLDKKINFKEALNKIPFFILSAIFSYITIRFQSEAGFINDFRETYSWYNRLIMPLYSIAYYLWHLLIPIPLYPKNIYPKEIDGMLPFTYYLGILFLLSLCLFLLKLKSNRRIWFFGLAFFIIIISPVLKIIPTGNDIVSNRYAYLPFIGLYIVWGHLLFLQKIKWLKIITAILCLIFIFQSFTYQQVYSNSETVWTAVIESTENDKYAQAMALNERGNVFLKQKKYDKAFQDISKALEINPYLYRGLLNRAIIYDLNANYKAALTDLNLAIELKPNEVDAKKLRGMIYTKLSQPQKALSDFNQAIKIDSSNPELYNNRGITHFILNDYKKAENDFNHALDLNPQNHEFMQNKANLFLKIGATTKAIQLYQLLYEKNKNLESAIHLAIAYLYNKEEDNFNKILSIYENNPQANAAIGEALLKHNFNQLSIRFFNKAKTNEDMAPQMQYMLTQAHLQMRDTLKAIEALKPLADKMKDSQLYFELGELYWSVSQAMEACKYWSKSTELNHTTAANQLKKHCQ